MTPEENFLKYIAEIKMLIIYSSLLEIWVEGTALKTKQKTLGF